MVKILTNENKSYELNKIPDVIDDIRYCVFDFSNKNDMDYYFLPLVFLESFYCPAIVMEIGPYTIQMPLDWSIVVCDEQFSDLEIIPLTSLNDRGFHSLVFNPLKHMVPVSYEVLVTNVYAEVKWYFPKLKNNNILIIPLDDSDDPPCVMFIKETGKLVDTLEISSLFV